jgi:hypothetical protein
MRLFRALRPNELPNLVENGIVARCRPCPPIDAAETHNEPACCKITDIQHVHSGTKSKEKSRYISTTADESVAAWWCSNKVGISSTGDNDKSATYIELKIDENKTVNICTPEILSKLGSTGKNQAMASCEFIIKDTISPRDIHKIFRVKDIDKEVFDDLPPEYTKNGVHYKTICKRIKKQQKYLLVVEIWSSVDRDEKINIVNGEFPADYHPHDKYIGKKVRKMYNGKMYDGIVSKKGSQFYKVIYDDNDREDMTPRELTRHMVDSKESNKTKRKRTEYDTDDTPDSKKQNTRKSNGGISRKRKTRTRKNA